MLVCEKRQVVEVVVCEAAVESNRAPAPNDNVFVEPAILWCPITAPPDSQFHERISPAKSNPAIHEYVFAFEIHADDIGRQLWQFFFDLGRETCFDDFVCIKSKYPVGRDRGRVEGPLKLLGVINEFVLQHFAPRPPPDQRFDPKKLSMTNISFANAATDLMARSMWHFHCK